MLDSISGLASLFYEHETDMLASIKQISSISSSIGSSISVLCSRAYPPPTPRSVSLIAPDRPWSYECKRP
jgi:hypothetical protein